MSKTTRCDILVIGGGAAGLGAAAALAPEVDLVLIEAEEAFGHHASGRSAALYEPGYGHAAITAMSRRSRPFFEEIGALSPRGLMLVIPKGEEEAHAAELAAPGMREISVAEAQALVPRLRGAAVGRCGLIEDAFDIDTDLMLQNFARTIRRHGGRIVLRAPAQALRRTGANWQVETPRGRFEAPIVVNAAGAWADRIARLAGLGPLGLRPMRRSVARIALPEGIDARRWPMLLGAGESWYAKPDAGALLVSPAEEDPTEPHDAWADDMRLAEGIARFQEMVALEVRRLIASWGGLRTFAPDRAPVIGFDPRAEGFFWLAGQGGSGMMSAPGQGILAREMILGAPPFIGADLAAAIAPDRLVQGGQAAN